MKSLDPTEITEAIARALAAGDLSRRRAEMLLGFVLLESAIPECEATYQTFYRRCRALKQVGLLQEQGLTAPVGVRWGPELSLGADGVRRAGDRPTRA